MAVIFVHGVPEDRGDLGSPAGRAGARRRGHAWSPPGFGAPVPDGFGATLRRLPGLADRRGGEAQRRAARPDRARLGAAGTWPRLGGRPAGPGPVLGHGYRRDLRPGVRVARHGPGLADRRPGRGAGRRHVSAARPGSRAEALVQGRDDRGPRPRPAAEQLSPADRPVHAWPCTAPPGSPAMATWGQQLEAAQGPAAAGDQRHGGPPTWAAGNSRTGRRSGWAPRGKAVLDGLSHWWMLQDPGPRAPP